MSRNTPRSRRAAIAAATPAAAKGASAASEATDDGWQRTLDITRAMVGASLGSSQAWMQGLGDWQQAQATALRHAGTCIDQVAGQAERAPDWPALWALQAGLAGTQWTQAMQDCGELIGQAMQIESRLVERNRADATRLSRQWFGGGDGAEDRDAPDAAQANPALDMLAQTQTMMSEMSRLWTQALYNTALPD